MLSNYDYVFWDWNGTLLDDVELALHCANDLLEKRGLPPIDGVSNYQEIFDFPVIEYYKRAGFDFERESFDVIAAEYNTLYNSKHAMFKMFNGSLEILETLKGMGKKQVVLSAAQISNLHDAVNVFDIAHYFEGILGLSDIFAKSKKAIGQKYISDHGLDASKILMIGDTTHDHDVAKALGVDCILIPNGHHPKHKLVMCGVPVLDDIKDLWTL